MPNYQNSNFRQQQATSGQNVALGTIGRTSQAGIRRRIPRQTSNGRDEPTDNQTTTLGGFVRFALFGCLGLLLFSIVLLTGAAQFGDILARAGHTPSEQKFEIVMANQVLNVSANSIRFPSQRRSEELNRLDLYAHWPTLSGYSDALSREFNNSGESSNIIFMTLEPRNMSFDMSGRLEPIYSMFLEGEASKTAPGLIKQALSESGGFIDEDLYYQTNSPYPFVARCVRDNSPIGTPFCIRDIHLDRDIMLTYRFHKRFLNQWISLEQGVREYGKSLLIKHQAAIH